MSTKTKKIISGVIGLSLVLTVAVIKEGSSINIDITSGELLKYGKTSTTNLIAVNMLTPSIKPLTSTIIKPLPVTCTSFAYTDFGACNCATLQKTRSASSSGPAGCTGGNPILSFPCTCTQVNTQNIKPINTGDAKDTTTNLEDNSADSGTIIAIPRTLREVKTKEMYGNQEYKNKVLELIASDSKKCSGDNSLGCFKKAYGLEELEKEGKKLTEKEIGDAIVFNKRPGEIVKNPRIVNLRGEVGSDPAILVVSKPADKLVVKISAVVENDGKEQLVPVITTEGSADKEGKSVLTLHKKLLPGKYVAKISTAKKLSELGKASVLDSSASDEPVEQESSFTVGENVDTEFYISDIEIKQENTHEPYEGEVKEMVSFLLANLSKIDQRFDAQRYIKFARTGGIIFIVEGKVSQDNIEENSIIYLAYKSVIFGSAVIADASQEGIFRAKVPRDLEETMHKLTLYAYNPKQAISSSLRSIQFQFLQ